MKTTQGPRVYSGVDPRYEWSRGKEFDTLVVDVAGMVYNFVEKLFLTFFFFRSFVFLDLQCGWL